jgi:hypothetical protein
LGFLRKCTRQIYGKMMNTDVLHSFFLLFAVSELI